MPVFNAVLLYNRLCDLPSLNMLSTDPSLDAKAAEIASMVGGGRDSNLDDDQQSDSQSSTIATPIAIRRSGYRQNDCLLIHYCV